MSMTGYLRKINMGIFYKLIVLSIIVFSGTTTAFGQCPTADAGGDQDMCANGVSISINGTATDYTSLLWETTGSGSFNDATTDDPIYTPSAADISIGNVVLTLHAYTSTWGCSTDSDNMTLTIEAAPTLSIGSNQTICETDNVNLNAIVTYYSSVLWTTSGDGSFSNDASVTPIYYPGANDIANTNVQLTLTVTANSPCSDINDVLNITINSLASANAGINATICEDGSYSLSDATATNYSSVVWSSSGSGTFSNSSSLNPTYNPSVADAANGTVTLTFQANYQSPCVGSVTDNMTLTILQNPTVSAGSNDIMCENETSYSLSFATASEYLSLAWTTSGDGSFSDNTALNPTYSPSAADFASGSVTLTLTANPNLPCGTISINSMTITFASEPTVDAGADETICEGSNLDISDASASLYDDLEWDTDGNGTFTNKLSLTTTYIPGSTDISTGTVNLTLTATATGACSGSVIDTRVLTIRSNPTVSAGSDETICFSEVLNITTASASDYLGLAWSTSGSGTFTNDNDLNPTYNPSAGDLTAGTITLTLTATTQSPCSNPTTDEMVLTITPAPTVDAGADDSFCTGNPSYQLTGSATNYSTIIWTTPGTGTINNPTSLIPTYEPSAADIISGSVELTMTVMGSGTCILESADDLMVLSFVDEPTANAGSDGSVCSGSSYTFTGTADNYNAIEWTTPGDGILINETTFTPTYTPGTGDIAAGSVTLTMTTSGQIPCTDDSDDMILTIVASPTVSAGDNQTICETTTVVTLTGSSANTSGVLWTIVSGTGTFSDATSTSSNYNLGSGDRKSVV